MRPTLSANPAYWAMASPSVKQVTVERVTAAIAAGVLTLDMMNGVAKYPTMNIKHATPAGGLGVRAQVPFGVATKKAHQSKR